MSGVVGVVRFDGQPVSRAAVDAMVDTLAQWGPDHSGSWSEGGVGLGHRLLRSTPESLRERQPLVGQGGKLVITADARIDNRAELLAALAPGAGPTEAISDGELILRAYERWGEDCPQRLLGDFAFAVWDARSAQLFCARDPMGVRPLYYHRSERLFAFGTQIRTLFALTEVPRRLNEAQLGGLLALLPPDRTHTFYRDIFALPPAHSLTLSAGDMRVRAYWRLDPTRRLRLRSDDEYAEAFREVFGEAVRCRLRSAFPLGATLSGGLDSSAIVCTARRMLAPDDRIVTLSAVFPSLRESVPRVDEKRYIDAVVGSGGVDARYVRADVASPLLDFLWRGEEPIPAAAMYMDWAVFQAAKGAGVRALLSGNDGDSVVGYGTAYLAELAWTLRWRRLWKELYALSRRRRVPRRALLQRFVLPTLMPRSVTRVWRALRANGRHLYDSRTMIRSEFAEQAGVYERVRRLEAAEPPPRTERGGHRYSLESPLLTMLVETVARASAVFALEPRYPFFDRRMMEFCLALPGDQKLHDGWNRVIMRRALEDVLPAEIQWRAGKQDLSPNFGLRLLDDRERLDDIVYGAPGRAGDFIDFEVLRGAYGRYLQNPARRTRDGFAVFWVVTITLWLRESGLAP